MHRERREDCLQASSCIAMVQLVYTTVRIVYIPTAKDMP